MANKTLLVVSNHPVEKWEEAQKRGWDDIVYIPHPPIDARLSNRELDKLVLNTMEIIKEAPDIQNIDNTYFCIQGDYGFTYRLQREIEYCFYIHPEQFVFPTTERTIINTTINADGSFVKETVFRFIQWR